MVKNGNMVWIIIKKETADQFYKTLIRKKCVLPIDMEIIFNWKT